MLVPGSNILNMALRAIQPTRGVTVRKYLGEGETSTGATVAQYSDPVPVSNCSLQPVPARDVQQLGLTVGRTYIKLISSADLHSAYRGGQGDKINWNGAEFTVLEPTSWIIQDGWTRVIAVKE